MLGQQAEYLWHKDADLKGADVVILPGGFAHGDYLRTGAMARFSPIMAPVRGVRRARRTGARHLQRLSDPARGRTAARRDAAQQGSEIPLRARAPARRADRHAVHRARATVGQVLRIPIGHGEGNYFAPPDMLAAARSQPPGGLPLHRSAGRRRRGVRTRTDRSTRSPALCNEARNVVGMMPHPERACEPLLGGVDGRVIFESIVPAVRVRRAASALQAHDRSPTGSRTPRPQAGRVRPHRRSSWAASRT